VGDGEERSAEYGVDKEGVAVANIRGKIAEISESKVLYRGNVVIK